MSFGGGLPLPFAHTRRCSKLHQSSTLRAVARRRGGWGPWSSASSSSSSFPVACVVVVLPRCCHPSLLPFHPRSTPQAVARGAGGGWCVVRHVVLVLGSLVVVPVVPIGGGGVTQPVAPEPPCEQVLAGVGGGCWCSPSLVSLAPQHGTHPQTTLRAAARRRGGGRRVVPGCWGPCRRLTPLPLSLTWPLAPAIPPAYEQWLVGLGRVPSRSASFVFVLFVPSLWLVVPCLLVAVPFGVVVGALGFADVLVVVVRPWRTHPPNEQLLVGVAVGVPSSFVRRR